ncbi:MAG: tetratricopeptide repeat protein [Polymorphobacter sp.]
MKRRWFGPALILPLVAVQIPVGAQTVSAVMAPAIVPQTALPVIDAAIAAGRYDDARDLIARTARGDDSPKLRLRSAELALARGALGQAATAFTDLAADPALAATAQQGLGLTRLRQGNVAAASAALDAALAADPALVRAWNARAVIADRARDFAAADAAYARALALDPANAMVLGNRGYSWLLRRRFAEAEADLARAGVLDPGLAAVQTNLRVARAMQGRYRDAFAGSTRARLATDLNTVGFAAVARGDMAVAESYFNRALALNPRFDQVAWANLRYLKARTDPLGMGSMPDDTLP